MKRAKRLVEYLEEELGWTVFTNEAECKKCHYNTNTAYCPRCGTKIYIKQIEANNKKILKDVEKAIKYALEEA